MKRFSLLFTFCILLTSSYAQIKTIEVSHYLFPEFTDGTILMKTGTKNEASLNYNSITEEMVFDKNGNKLAIANSMYTSIDTIYIKDKKFILLNDKFLEQVHASKYTLLVEHKCDLSAPSKPSAYGGESNSSASTSYTSLATNGMVYELALPSGYKVKPFINYWLKVDGTGNKFSNLKQLIKLFPDKKVSIKTFIKENNVEYNNQESIIKLIEFIENN
ncbi:MAG: hypothetical protein AB7S48_16980 [Bacteroidales bacterium]